MAIVAHMQEVSGWIVCAGSDFLHFGFHFSREGLDPIWMAWSGLGQTYLAWKLIGVQESPGLLLAESNQLATSFSLSDATASFHRQLRSYCAKPAQIGFGSGWLCQVLVKWIQSRSKPVCKNHQACFWPVLPSQSRSDPACLLRKQKWSPSSSQWPPIKGKSCVWVWRSYWRLFSFIWMQMHCFRTSLYNCFQRMFYCLAAVPAVGKMLSCFPFICFSMIWSANPRSYQINLKLCSLHVHEMKSLGWTFSWHFFTSILANEPESLGTAFCETFLIPLLGLLFSLRNY